MCQAGGLTQVEEHLPSKLKAVRSNLSTAHSPSPAPKIKIECVMYVEHFTQTPKFLALLKKLGRFSNTRSEFSPWTLSQF
jgi:hypothetical protein